MKEIKVLGIEEAAELLNLNPQTVSRLARGGKLPMVKVGGVWRALESELLDHLKGKKTNGNGNGNH